MSDTPPPGAREFMQRFFAALEAQEITEPHCILLTDPVTGLRQVIGAYPDAVSALAGILRLEERWKAMDPDHREPGELPQFELAMWFPEEDA